ncbi:MAG: hypothetical protein AB7I30_15510 [Isosphaeraceae bacterium]
MTGPDVEIQIRPAQTVADYFACQRAQRLAWGIEDDGYLVPIATMVGAQHHGGLVLGAFLPDSQAVGLSFAFLGRTDGQLCLYSQLTGVVPGYQDRGLGGRMKARQREFAREQGLPLIVWAFDPLQAGNAQFNLNKLGATSRRYLVDMYGPRTDALNRATPTDRLIAVWRTEPTPPRVVEPDRFAVLPKVVGGRVNADWDREPEYLGLPGYAEALLLEIPDDVNRLRAERPDLAWRWGQVVREGFLACFRSGYVAVGFVREEGRGAYLLERSP